MISRIPGSGNGARFVSIVWILIGLAAALQLFGGQVTDPLWVAVLFVPAVWGLGAAAVWPFLGIYLTRGHLVVVSWFRIFFLARDQIVDVYHEQYRGTLTGPGSVAGVDDKIRILRIVFRNGVARAYAGTMCSGWRADRMIERLKERLGITTAPRDPLIGIPDEGFDW